MSLSLWRAKRGEITLDPDGMRWIVLDNAEVPEAYWEKHSNAWALPTATAPWERTSGNYENYAAGMGSAHKGSSNQVLIPEYYTLAKLPAEWGEVCY